MSARLVTIPVSHYCEKARWALDRQGVAYREEMHLPLFAWGPALRAGGKRTVPTFVDEEGRAHPSSQEIVAYADARRGDRPALVPDAARDEVLALQRRFDDDLGPHSRRYAYAAVLPDKETALKVAGGRAPAWQRAAARAGYPVVVAILRRGLKIDDAGVQRSRAKIETTWAFVDALLADGRRFLVGDAFTAADLTFAALAAPLVLPPQYFVPFPPVDVLPLPYRDEMRAWAARPAGRFALRMYEQERAPPA